MDLKDDFSSGVAVPELTVATPEGVFEAVAKALVDAGDLKAASSGAVRDAFLERERQGTTAFGDGFCIPHVMHGDLKRARIVVLRYADGVDMRALDGELTRVFCCVAAPESEEERYRAILDHIATIAQDRKWRTLIEQNENSEDICGILADAIQT